MINLDPAVTNVPYEPNIDVRETVNYKDVMKQYDLPSCGPAAERGTRIRSRAH